jgi:deoxyribose-phosphate aldolase
VNNLAQMIDHTLLKPEATLEDIKKLCEEAKTHEFFSVCVNPYWVKTAAELLKGSSVKVCTVIGFPLGASATPVKAFETKHAIEEGAEEVDMVINIGELKAGNLDAVQGDIAAVVNAASGQALVKVILETCLLTDEEIVNASQCAKHAGAEYVKTSTGFSTGGATVEAVRLMRQTVGPEMGVKASGGVRDTAGANAMVEAGATRIGASAGIKIIQGE